VTKDINKDKFTDETILKLDIFSECFREWFPVFIHSPHVKGAYIYDFFAGTGKDTEDSLGSPLKLLGEAKGENCKNCLNIKKNNKPIHFIFNEKEKTKQEMLIKNVNEFMSNCLSKNCKTSKCVYSYENFKQMEFKDEFQSKEFQDILKNENYGKFILLDQYGFKQVDESVFSQLVNAPKTDFIFFVSSSFIRRFKELPVIKQYFDTEKINFDETKPQECHRLIAQYYKKLIPINKDYYLHHFTIKKETNYWGLIFGTNHSLGMEKFLRVCWRHDELSGESNFNINNDFPKGTLFFNEAGTMKKQNMELEIRNKVLSKNITNNISGFKYALKNGCLPELFTSTIKKLESEKKIVRIGNLNYSSTDIHKVIP
jgi:three-Cys-motif partner protein